MNLILSGTVVRVREQTDSRQQTTAVCSVSTTTTTTTADYDYDYDYDLCIRPTTKRYSAFSAVCARVSAAACFQVLMSYPGNKIIHARCKYQRSKYQRSKYQRSKIKDQRSKIKVIRGYTLCPNPAPATWGYMSVYAYYVPAGYVMCWRVTCYVLHDTHSLA